MAKQTIKYYILNFIILKSQLGILCVCTLAISHVVMLPLFAPRRDGAGVPLSLLSVGGGGEGAPSSGGGGREEGDPADPGHSGGGEREVIMGHFGGVERKGGVVNHLVREVYPR